MKMEGPRKLPPHVARAKYLEDTEALSAMGKKSARNRKAKKADNEFAETIKKEIEDQYLRDAERHALRTTRSMPDDDSAFP